MDGSDDYDTGASQENNFMNSERMEKSMTNRNVNLAAVVGMVEDLNNNHQEFTENMMKEQEEFNINFTKKQEALLQEIRLIRIEHSELRKNMKPGI